MVSFSKLMHTGFKMDLKNYFIQKKQDYHSKLAPKASWVHAISEKKYVYYFFFNFLINAPINVVTCFYKVPILGVALSSIFILASLAIFKLIHQEHTVLKTEHNKNVEHHFTIWFDKLNKTKEEQEIFIKCSLIFDIITMTERLKNKDMLANFENMQKAEKDLFLLEQNKYDYFPKLVKSLYDHIFSETANLYKDKYNTYQIKLNTELRDIYFNLLNNYVNNFYTTRQNFELKNSSSHIKASNDEFILRKINATM